ncbi:MAG TPA: aspartyl protease family protein [Terriglobales bacterium]|nr:aspartyl protease family protein [Terriglobales bacterium]
MLQTLRVTLFVAFIASQFFAISAQSAAPAAPPSPQSSPAAAPLPAGAPPAGPLADALAFYRKGEFDAAIQKYQQILQENPKSSDAYAGMARAYLKKKDVAQADETVKQGLQLAEGPSLHVALGEVEFRQGKISAAEQEWVTVINSGHPEARAYLGLARVRWAVSMYKSGQDMIEKAHQLDPADPEIRRVWVGKLSLSERIKFLQEYLDGENNEDEETRTAMRHYLEYLIARQKDPRGTCHLIGKTETTETPLVRLLIDPNHIRGYGLAVTVNNEKSKLLLDTGASGIMINRSLAEKAGVTRLSSVEFDGIGDKGNKSGYMALANSLKVGDLEFQNCPVQVIEARSVVGEDGLIGPDVFSGFLVDLDFPNETLRLRQLPKRPAETAAPLALKTNEEDADEKDGESESQPSATTASKPAAAPTRSGPYDRYIAPEMKSYAVVFRFGHALLVPTSIGPANSSARLFLLDSGAAMNQITPAAASEITKVHGDSSTTIKGISGSVKKVYSADKVTLLFGHVRQENLDLVTFDLTHMSDRFGTEVSGILGFAVLHYLDVKIDYRDGLVDFSYVPKPFSR